jgi:ketosteroid isomerase-like protein
VKKFVAVLLSSIAFTGWASAASLNSEAQSLETQYVDAFNHKDGAKLASFFTEDGVTVAQNGAVTSGGSNLAKMYSNIAGHFVLAVMLDQIHSQGDGGWALAHGTQTFPDGHVVKTHAVFIYGRENGDLKFRVLSFGTNVPLASAE